MELMLVPFLYIMYAFALLARPPKPGVTWGFCTQRAQKSEKAWYYAQRAMGVYCAAAGLFLYLAFSFFVLAAWVQLLLELAVLAGVYPTVTVLLKKAFPDD